MGTGGRVCFCILIVFVLGFESSNGRILQKRDASGPNQLFLEGEEYRFNYEVLITTGTEEPVSHASSYRLKGVLRVQGTTSNTITVQLEDVGIGLFNGQWSYFPVPSFEYIKTEDLSSLSLPFQIVSENGKFKTLLMNDQEPEWASNMKRGLATYLQMNMERVTPQKLMFFKDEELTTLGVCPTMYEVMPVTATGMGLARVSKFRNHADCPDVPTRVRREYGTFYNCQDNQTRDIKNSTAYAIYDLSVQDTKITIQRLTVLSSILYWPFTQTGPFLYSWYNMTLALENVGPITVPIPPPDSSMEHEDLTYVFEQSDYSEPDDDISDLKVVEPLFFHQTSHELDPEVVEKIMEKCHETTASLAKSLLTADVLEDLEQFHGQTPTALIPLISSLDYDSLTRCYAHYSGKAGNSEQESLEFQLFLDGLAHSGTPAAALVIRDILVKSGADDAETLTRLINSFHNAIRHPSEALALELDPIFDLAKNPKVEPRHQTMVALSMAALISRSCKKNLCSSSGLLEKYINYFEDKLLNGDNFEDQVVGVLGLGNIGLGRALEKPFEIAQGLHPQFENAVRIQSIWSLRPLILEQRDRVMTSLLPVFFNRSEACETRASTFGFLMGSRPDERVLHEIAYFMWSETCMETLNMVRSTLTLMSKTEYPCNPVRSYARTVLKYLPPGKIDPQRSGSYALDYYDKQNGFGRMIFMTGMRTGKSVIPLSIYMGVNSYMGGFSNSYFGMYIRLQGIEKAIEANIPKLAEGNVDRVIEILSKIEIEERKGNPLRLELVIINSGKVIQYLAADEKTLGAKIKSLIIAFQESAKKFAKGAAISTLQPALSAGVRYEQPLEIGTPVSIFANLATNLAVNSNVTQITTAGGSTIKEEDSVGQTNMFATTGVTNHIPAVNTMLTIQMLRTWRMRFPMHSSSTSQSRNRPDALHFALFVPRAENPFAFMTHAKTEVTVRGDVPNGIADEDAEAKLKQSCPSCPMTKIVSRGEAFRREREISIPKPKLLRGVTSYVKYFDCERDHSKAALLKRLKMFFSDTGKNTGYFAPSLAAVKLGLDHALDTLLIAPHSETCGLKAIFAQDPAAPVQTKKITGSVGRKVGQSQNKMELLGTFILHHYGEEESETKVDIIASLKDSKSSSNKHQQINVKAALINGPSGESGIACFDFDNRLRATWEDPLAFTGQSEPVINQTINIKIGKFPTGEPNRQSSVQDLPCLSNHADITFTGDAQRSQEQVEEAEASAVWPYNQCQADKASNLWPGKFIPPTRACELVMMEQTQLRSANMSVCYKVVKSARNRWAPLIHLGASFLSPYMVDSGESADVTDHAHSASEHNHQSGSGSADPAVYLSGDVEISMDLRKQQPKLDVHYSRQDGEEERHYHNVDLSLLPNFLIPEPGPGRVSPLNKIQRALGIAGSCSISPAAVLTLDGFVYPITISAECSVLVSGDCSKRSQYAILARQMPNQQLAVIIQVQDTRIELQNPTTAVIDGTLKTFRSFEEFEKTDKFLMYTRKDEIYVTFTTPHISIRYTGSFITVDMGSMFKGVNCGLCGNWDNNPYNDLMGPKKCKRPLTPPELVQSWVVREGQCTDVGQTCPDS